MRKILTSFAVVADLVLATAALAQGTGSSAGQGAPASSGMPQGNPGRPATRRYSASASSPMSTGRLKMYCAPGPWVAAPATSSQPSRST